MASDASWQTSAAVRRDTPFSEDARAESSAPSFSDDRRAGNSATSFYETGRAGNGAPWNKPLYEPVDQHMVEGLLQRLVDRFEESERLYGEAIEELHSRLDRLSQNQDTAEPAVADSFDRLHAQVRDLAQRFEPDPTTLENFERLGKALSGRGDTDDTAQAQSTPEPSPFAKSVMGLEPPSYGAPALSLEEDLEPPAFTPAYRPRAIEAEEEPAFDKQLVDMAAKLEQSIDTAMPSGAIEALNARLDVIGHRLAEAADNAPSRENLEQIESHMAGMGQQLAHAEAQLGKIEGVEEQLRKLIVQLDEKGTDRDPAGIAPEQAQDIATKAAGNAARLVADDTQETTERLDAMQRELAEISQTSRISSDKVISTLEAVNASLNQLARQVENTTPSNPELQPPRATDGETKSPLGLTPSKTSAPSATLSVPRPIVESASSQTSSQAPVAAAAEPVRPATPAFKEPTAPDTPPAARKETADDTLLNAAPDDLVAAARQAAEAAAARAEERAEQRSKRTSGRSDHSEQPANRWRPLLIITAAGLLVVSAALLYGRLGTKTEPVQSPAATGSSAPAAAPATQPNGNGNTAVPKGPAPSENQRLQAPAAGSSPASGAADKASEIEVGQTWGRTSGQPAHRLASGVALPPGVSFPTETLSSRVPVLRARGQ